MDKLVLERKIDHMRSFLKNLKDFSAVSPEEFLDKVMVARATEREFQLFVDLAIDINSAFILESSEPVPDSYFETFLAAGKVGLIPQDLARSLAPCAKVRNILVHEYDIDLDVSKFYASVKQFIPFFEKYMHSVMEKLSK